MAFRFGIQVCQQHWRDYGAQLIYQAGGYFTGGNGSDRCECIIRIKLSDDREKKSSEQMTDASTADASARMAHAMLRDQVKSSSDTVVNTVHPTASSSAGLYEELLNADVSAQTKKKKEEEASCTDVQFILGDTAERVRVVPVTEVKVEPLDKTERKTLLAKYRCTLGRSKKACVAAIKANITEPQTIKIRVWNKKQKARCVQLTRRNDTVIDLAHREHLPCHRAPHHFKTLFCSYVPRHMRPNAVCRCNTAIVVLSASSFFFGGGGVVGWQRPKVDTHFTAPWGKCRVCPDAIFAPIDFC